MDGVRRAAFAFDALRQAIVLVGDKSGESQAQFYRTPIATADKRFSGAFRVMEKRRLRNGAKSYEELPRGASRVKPMPVARSRRPADRSRTHFRSTGQIVTRRCRKTCRSTPQAGSPAARRSAAKAPYFPRVIVTDSANAQAAKQIEFAIDGANGFLSTIFPSNSIFHYRVDTPTTGLPVDASPAAPIYFGYLPETVKPFVGEPFDG